MTVNQLIEALDLSIVTHVQEDRDVSGCYIGDLLSWVMSRAQHGDVWITVQTNINVVAVASLTDCACIILCDGVSDMPPEVVDRAEKQEVIILKSDKSGFELAREISAWI